MSAQDRRPDRPPAPRGPARARGEEVPAEPEPLSGEVIRPGESAGTSGHRRGTARMERIALVDLLDRVLAGGVVVTGEIRLAVADVDMVSISLRALVSSVSTAFGTGGDEPEADR